MHLDGLKALYRGMLSLGIERYRFEFKIGKVTFDVFFFIDERPFVLLFGAKGHIFSFEIEVQKGFEINPFLEGDTYRKLCEILGLEFDPSRPFSPKSFFDEFNRSVPRTAVLSGEAEPHKIAAY